MAVITAATGFGKAALFVLFAVSTTLNLLSMTGIADSVVRWRCFLDVGRLVETYLQFRHALFALFPFRVSSFVQDYITVAGSFGLMLNGYSLFTTGHLFPVGYGPRSTWWRVAFSVAFYLVPWLFVVAMWRFLDRQKKLLDGQSHLTTIPELREGYNAKVATLRRERTAYTMILVFYPIACLVGLLLFSDFAYKVFGIREIGGLSIDTNCTVH